MRTKDPEVSRKAEHARELLAANPDMTRREAAAAVGISAPSLTRRLNGDPRGDGADHVELADMPDTGELPIFVRDYTDRDKHTIYPIGDLHIGSPGHAGAQLDEWFAYLEATPNVSMLNTGDNTNCALKSSVSEAYDEQLTVGEARRAQTELFWNLAGQGKIDAVIDGNHEDRVFRSTGDSPNAAVCDTLGLNYDRAACIVRYLVGDVSYDLYLRHGTGGGGTMGAQVNNLEKQERIIAADVYVSGHTHTQVAFVKDIFVPGAERIDRAKRLFVCGGSFVAYEEYAAKQGYSPAHIGAPRVYLSGRTKDAHASV